MENFWKELKLQKPNSYKRGNWDGRMSDEILICDDRGYFFVGFCYQGTLDGNEYCNFYDKNDSEIEDVVRWAEIPEPQ